MNDLMGVVVNIDHMREFICLAETLSFSATAKRFYISQSVLSKRIASMEGELGVPLFTRDSHHVRLTKSGKAFLEEAASIVGGYERALARVQAVNQEYETVARVGYLRNAARPFLTMFLKRMKKEHPEVRLTLTCMEYGELFTAVNTQKVDIGFVIDLDADTRSRCDSFAIYEDRFDAIVSRDHPLAAYEETGVTSDMLCGEKLLLPDPAAYPGMSDFVEGILDGCGNWPYRRYSDVDTMYLDVETSDYVAMSSEHNIPVFGDMACFLRINDRKTSYNVSALWLKDTNSSVTEPCLNALAYCRDWLASRLPGARQGEQAEK